MDKTGYLLTCVLAAFLWVQPLSAQKKEIDEARSYIKSGKDLKKAEKLMTDLLQKDASNRKNTKVYKTWFDVVVAQYGQANEKLYLKEKYDTAAFFSLARRLFDIGLTLDSLDAQPDKKGRVRPEYRRSHAELLSQLRPNLYYGGTFHVRKGQFAEAFDFFSHYLDMDVQPLFTGYHDAATDSLMPEAAYWASYCGYRLHHTEDILRYSQLAMRDKTKESYVLQYVAEAYLMQQRQEAYLQTLRDGFARYPEHLYFFPRLADYYKSQNLTDSLMVIADRGLEVNGENTLFLLAKSIALLNAERYDECINVSQQMIQLNDTLPEPYFNIATCYLNQALALEQLGEPRKYRQKIRRHYAAARPYMEDYRRMVPDDRQHWAPALYRIYLNLNMGRQFEEIDRLMR